MLQVQEAIVVEGKADSNKIHQAVEAETIETNGSAVDPNVLEQIRHASEKRGIIIFTDPDYPGERIRHIVDEAVPGAKHAFLTRHEAKSDKARHRSVGIEHASIASIQEALRGIYQRRDPDTAEITQEDILAHGLIGVPEARYRREKVGEKLRIGHTNGKQLLRRLTLFEITRKQLDEAMDAIGQERYCHGE